MLPSGNKKIRVFPFRPTPERGSFVDFIEETGTNAFLIEAVKKLYEVSNKPENPIEWLRLYFKYMAPDRSKEMLETEQLLKAELTEIEAKLINAVEEEAQNQDILQRLEHEYKKITMLPRHNQHYDDFRKYERLEDDYHYRINPNPSYQPSITDMLAGYDQDDPAGEDLFTEDGVPYYSADFQGDGNPPQKKLSERKMYDDYPAVFFPDHVQRRLSTADGEEEEDEEEEDTEEEEGEYEGEEEGEDGGDPGASSTTGGSPPATKEAVKKRKTTAGAKGEKKLKGKKVASGVVAGMMSTTKLEGTAPLRKSLGSLSVAIPKGSKDAGGELPEETLEEMGRALRKVSFKKDPLMEKLEPVTPSFWKDDFSVRVKAEVDEMCLESEHFNFEQVKLTRSALRMARGVVMRKEGVEGELEDHSFQEDGESVVSWIMDPHLVEPSFADKLVYTGIPYDEQVTSQIFDDDDEEDPNEVLESDEDEERIVPPCCESKSSNEPCECECEEAEARCCTTSYCPTSSGSSYKEEDAGDGGGGGAPVEVKRKSKVVRQSIATTTGGGGAGDDLESRISKSGKGGDSPPEEDNQSGGTLYSETVAPSVMQFETDNNNM